MPAKKRSSKRNARQRSLVEYRRKRDFAQTSEPRTTSAKAIAHVSRERRAPLFVVQHHRASNDHHDFRLEHRGVLLSWAVPKLVSRTVGHRRLAIQVEDHPLAYAAFEGTIPKGAYGAGTVETWDVGTWDTDEDIDAALVKGSLSFTLHGSKLKGPWSLVRMEPRDENERQRQPQWLLIRRSRTR